MILLANNWRLVLFGVLLLACVSLAGIANHTSLPVTLTTLGWRFDRKFYWHQMLGDKPSHSLPKKLEYGEKAFFWVSLENRESDWFNEFAQELNEKGAKAKTVECGITTSTGGVRYFPVDHELRQKFRQLVK